MQLLTLFVATLWLTCCIDCLPFERLTSSSTREKNPDDGRSKRSATFADDPEDELDELRFNTAFDQPELAIPIVLHAKRWLHPTADNADDLPAALLMESLVRAQDGGTPDVHSRHASQRKRQFNSWGGKRNFNSWGGKKRRAAPAPGQVSSQSDSEDNTPDSYQPPLAR